MTPTGRDLLHALAIKWVEGIANTIGPGKTHANYIIEVRTVMRYNVVPTREVFDTVLGWKVTDDLGNFVCECYDEAIANRIARGLTLLDESKPVTADLSPGVEQDPAEDR